jgi:hypothetical protein
MSNGLAVAPGGGLFVSDGDNNRIRYIAPESISLVNDSGQTALVLPWIGALTGNFTVTDNANLTTVKAGALASIGGDLIISNNSSAVNILTWSTVGGKSYRAQTKGSLLDSFGDFGSLIIAPGTGESTTNILDADATTNATRFYRVLLIP